MFKLEMQYEITNLLTHCGKENEVEGEIVLSFVTSFHSIKVKRIRYPSNV